tara:strand:- start:174 stop:350 length:177 start_codon:yes stop_codon:yes gene_type:complete
MEDENDYYVECPFCEIHVEVFVKDSEPPSFCPMCGEQIQYDEFDEDEYEEDEEDDYEG